MALDCSPEFCLKLLIQDRNLLETAPLPHHHLGDDPPGGPLGSGPCGFRQEYFFMFSPYKPIYKTCDSGVGPFLAPGP